MFFVCKTYQEYPYTLCKDNDFFYSNTDFPSFFINDYPLKAIKKSLHFVKIISRNLTSFGHTK